MIVESWNEVGTDLIRAEGIEFKDEVKGEGGVKVAFKFCTNCSTFN